MKTTAPERIAAVILAFECLVLLAVTGWELVALVSGDTESVSSSIALLVLTGIGAVAVGAFSVVVWRGGSWGRSGGVVTQLLALAVALGAMTGDEPQPAVAAAVAVPAVMCLIALVLGSRNAGRRVREAD